jgi:hypothetical protein
MTPNEWPESVRFYLEPGPMSTIPAKVNLGVLPDDLPALVRVVQGLLIHVFWAERYGIKLNGARQSEVNLRSFKEKFPALLHLSDAPLTEPRPLEKRLVGNCRDFSDFLAALLKQKGIPARARCGFGRYFLPNHYEDRWVTEYWNTAEKRWGMVDAQLDEFQQKELKITFDTLNVPSYQFITGGKAWLLCRAGQANPDQFGIFKMRGMGFIRGDLIRDFLALNRIEILPWDAFGLIAKADNQLSEADLALLDHLAGLTLTPDAAFAEIRQLYAQEKELQVPASWFPIV